MLSSPVKHVPKLAQGGGERRPITAECMSWITATKCADKVLSIKHQVKMPSARDLRDVNVDVYNV